MIITLSPFCGVKSSFVNIHAIDGTTAETIKRNYESCGQSLYDCVGIFDNNPNYPFTHGPYPNNPTIQYDINMAELDIPTSKTHTFGDKYELPAVNAPKGYVFAGWFTSKTGGHVVTNEDKAYISRTLYAHWYDVDDTTNVITVSFDPNTYSPIKVAKHGSYQNLPTVSSTDTGEYIWFDELGNKVTNNSKVMVYKNHPLTSQFVSYVARIEKVKKSVLIQRDTNIRELVATNGLVSTTYYTSLDDAIDALNKQFTLNDSDTNRDNGFSYVLTLLSDASTTKRINYNRQYKSLILDLNNWYVSLCGAFYSLLCIFSTFHFIDTL